VLKLILLVVPLALDSFGAAVAVGLAGVPGSQRRRALVLFPLMETLAAGIGLLAGVPLGNAIGDSASAIGAVVVIGIGTAILLERDDSEDARELAAASGWRLFAVGAAISADELVLGLSLGLLGLPALPALLLIAAQAVLVTQVGIRLGAEIGRRIGAGAERAGGVALILVGLVLLAEAL
jgi:putative Mn2+ efflux pump MntP